MKKLICFVFSAVFSACGQKQAAEILSVDTFLSQVQQQHTQLIDVRTETEFAQGHIAHAQNMDVLEEQSFLKYAEKLNKNQAVYVYCRSGNRSKRASRLLQSLGFKEIFDLEGGYQNYIKFSKNK